MDDLKWEPRKWRGGVGMGAGLAKKLGNAGGVKAPTAVDRGWTNICHIQRWRTDGT